MTPSDSTNYIAKMPEERFVANFDSIVHTDAFSAIASRVQDRQSCSKLRNMLADTDIPKELYSTNDSLIALVRAISGRWLMLRDR